MPRLWRPLVAQNSDKNVHEILRTYEIGKPSSRKHAGKRKYTQVVMLTGLPGQLFKMEISNETMFAFKSAAVLNLLKPLFFLNVKIMKIMGRYFFKKFKNTFLLISYV